MRGIVARTQGEVKPALEVGAAAGEAGTIDELADCIAGELAVVSSDGVGHALDLAAQGAGVMLSPRCTAPCALDPHSALSEPLTSMIASRAWARASACSSSSFTALGAATSLRIMRLSSLRSRSFRRSVKTLRS